MELTKSNQALVTAYKKGYRVAEDGQLLGTKGQPMNGYIQSGYRMFTVRLTPRKEGDNQYKVAVHRLQAYQKYGKRIFDPEIVIRHKDGNSLNNSRKNLLKGTQAQNMMDKLPHDRSRYAKHAAKKRKHALSDEKLAEMKRRRAEGVSMPQLATEFGISKSTVSYHLSKKAKRMAVNHD